MKILLLLLCIALCSTQVKSRDSEAPYYYESGLIEASFLSTEDRMMAGQYVDVPIDNISQNQEASEFLDYAVEELIAAGRAQGKIPEGTFKLSKITSVQKQISGSDFTYKFEFEVSDSQKTTVTATVAVTYKSKLKKKILTSYNYSVKTVKIVTTKAVAEEFVDYDKTIVETDSALRKVINDSISSLVTKARTDKKIPNDGTDFSITEITRVQRQKIGTNYNYQIELVLKNSRSVTITVTFTIYYSSKTTSYQLTQYSYKATYKVVKITVAYQAVSSTELKLSKTLQTMISGGVSSIMNSLIKNNKVTGTFKSTKIISVKREVVNIDNYRVKVSLISTTGLKVTIIFRTQYSTSTTKFQVVDYKYKVTQLEYKDGAYVDTPDTGDDEYDDSYQGSLGDEQEQDIDSSQKTTSNDASSNNNSVTQSTGAASNSTSSSNSSSSSSSSSSSNSSSSSSSGSGSGSGSSSNSSSGSGSNSASATGGSSSSTNSSSSQSSSGSQNDWGSIDLGSTDESSDNSDKSDSESSDGEGKKKKKESSDSSPQQNSTSSGSESQGTSSINQTNQESGNSTSNATESSTSSQTSSGSVNQAQENSTTSNPSGSTETPQNVEPQGTQTTGGQAGPTEPASPGEGSGTVNTEPTPSSNGDQNNTQVVGNETPQEVPQRETGNTQPNEPVTSGNENNAQVGRGETVGGGETTQEAPNNQPEGGVVPSEESVPGGHQGETGKTQPSEPVTSGNENNAQVGGGETTQEAPNNQPEGGVVSSEESVPGGQSGADNGSNVPSEGTEGSTGSPTEVPATVEEGNNGNESSEAVTNGSEGQETPSQGENLGGSNETNVPGENTLPYEEPSGIVSTEDTTITNNVSTEEGYTEEPNQPAGPVSTNENTEESTTTENQTTTSEPGTQNEEGGNEVAQVPQNPETTTETESENISSWTVEHTDSIYSPLKFGAQYVMERIEEKEGLPSSRYEISSVISAHRTVKEEVTKYTFDVKLVDCRDILIRAVFIVSYNENTQEKDVERYDYRIADYRFLSKIKRMKQNVLDQ